MKKAAFAAALATCCSALTACTVLELEVGEEITPDALDSFEVGVTTRSAVLEQLGAPTSLAPCADGCALLYEWIVLDEAQFGLSLDSVGALLGVAELGLLKLSLGDSDADRRALVLIFDAEHRLLSATVGSWSEEFGRGGSVQLFVALQQVVDSGQLRDSERGMDWGGELLEPPFALLNLSHLPAIELRGASAGFGQKTLGGAHAEEMP